MFRAIFIFSFLLVTTSVFSQSKFMVGVCVNPNLSIFSSPDYSFGKGVSIGGGATIGVYLCKKVFLLTGAELITTRQVFTGSYTLNYQPVPNYHYKTTNQQSFWDIPLLANYMLTKKDKKVSFFLTVGAVFGEYTMLRTTSNDVRFFNNNVTYTGNEIRNRHYAAAIAGAGCKVNLSNKLSLFIIPDYRGVPNMVEVRTMLMYNFGNGKAKKS